MIIAVDLDGMFFAFPDYFVKFFSAMQSAGHKVGVLSARLESQRADLIKQLDELNVKPDFMVLKPDALQDYPRGIYKAMVCNDLDIDVLYDDFDYSNQKVISDFFSVNDKTIPMTSWAYRPEE